jgi:hypothetical protein
MYGVEGVLETKCACRMAFALLIHNDSIVFLHCMSFYVRKWGSKPGHD